MIKTGVCGPDMDQPCVAGYRFASQKNLPELRYAVKPKSLWFWPLILLAGCAGPVATCSGIAGSPISPGAAVALAPAPEGAGNAAEAVRAAVSEALVRQGYRLAANAPLRIEAALAERDAGIDLRPLAGPISGPVLSPAKAQRPLQDCRDRTHRLTLVAYDPARPEIVRVWAEEYHCHGTLAASLPALAERAVIALAAGGPDQITVRAGQD